MINKLLNSTKEIWELYNKHPFVIGIQNANLDKKKFRYYIIQDYLYLRDYAKTFAIGVAKSKSLETANLFLKCVEIMNGELNIHSGYLKKFDVSQKEIDSAVQSIDNLSYTSYMLRVAYEGNESEILAAITPCAYSYEVIAKNILKNNPKAINNSFYGDWIKGYSCEEYSNGNKILLNIFNDLIKDYTEKEFDHIKNIFVNCSKYELAFWDMSWKTIN